VENWTASGNLEPVALTIELIVTGRNVSQYATHITNRFWARATETEFLFKNST